MSHRAGSRRRKTPEPKLSTQPFTGEQSVEVTETETGFSVGDNSVNAVPVAVIEDPLPDSFISESDKDVQALALNDKFAAETQDIELSLTYEKKFTDDEYHEMLQGNSGQIDNEGCLITRIPAEESAKTQAEDAPAVDEY